MATRDTFEGLFSQIYGMADPYTARMLANDRSSFPEQPIDQWASPFVPSESVNGRIVVFCRRCDILMPAFGTLPVDWCMGVFVIADGGVEIIFDDIRETLGQGVSGYVRADRPGNWSANFELATNQNSQGKALFLLGQLSAPPA